jgi:type IV pilus assembly protein PilC
LGNGRYRSAVKEARDRVVSGEALSEAFSLHPDIYSVLMIQMIKVGEETGRTSEVLLKLADFLEKEVTNSTQNLASVIEPLVMLMVGGAVGFFAVSMIQPMYSMMGAIQ